MVESNELAQALRLVGRLQVEEHRLNRALLKAQEERRLLHDRLSRTERELAGWIEAARHHHGGSDYYRGLLVEIGKMLGASAYVADDGTVSGDVLVAKVPDLVLHLLEANKALCRESR